MNIMLIGMPSSGKSTLGAELSQRLHYNLIDIDEVIKSHHGSEIYELLAKYGANQFSKLEEKSTLGLGEFENTIISPGGSIVYGQRAMAYLCDRSRVVFLDVEKDVIQARLLVGRERGIVGLEERGFDAIFDERRLLYQKYADITIPINANSTIDDVAAQILKKTF